MQNKPIIAIKRVAIKIAAFKKAGRLLLVLTTAINLSACAAHYGAAKIVSTPSGAQVINGEDGSIIGTTPVTMRWKNASGNRQTIILKLKKPGYYEKTSSFWLDMRKRNAKAATDNPQLVEIEMQKVGE